MTSIVIILIDFKPPQGCPKLIGGGRQQALGFDAGLDGGVEPDEVQGDVADQCEVVGDVAGDSEKIRKAKRLGVRVVSVYELITIGISKKAES